MYFITIHLAGAIPPSAANRIREMIKLRPPSRPSAHCLLQSAIFAELERWLDCSNGLEHLVHPEVARMVMEAIEHRSANRAWEVFEYVIMPSHLHSLLRFLTEGLKAGMENFKRWTGRGGVRILQLEKHQFWQREWFDHWVRAPEEAAGIADYIRQNPVKAGLVEKYEDWPYGSWHK